MLSDECAALLSAGPQRPERRTLTVEQNRAALEGLAPRFGSGHPDVGAEDSVLGGVPIRVYRPMAAQVDGGVCLYAHGGGWVLGSLDTHHAFCSHLAATSGSTVVSIGYRQPPEFPFPAAVDDVVSVARALAAEGLGGADATRMAIAGDSAGGNLAAAAALALRGEVALRLAVLLLPVLDNRLEQYDSYREFAAGPSLTRDDMTWYFEHYAGPSWRDQEHPLLVPMQARDLAGFPETLVVTAECDVLRDEGEAFAGRLRSGDVPVRLIRVPGTFHPYLLFLAELQVARDTVELVGHAVREALMRPI